MSATCCKLYSSLLISIALVEIKIEFQAQFVKILILKRFKKARYSRKNESQISSVLGHEIEVMSKVKKNEITAEAYPYLS